MPRYFLPLNCEIKHNWCHADCFDSTKFRNHQRLDDSLPNLTCLSICKKQPHYVQVISCQNHMWAWQLQLKVGFQLLLSRCFSLCCSCVDAVRWNPRRSSCKGRCWPTWRMLPLLLDMLCFSSSAVGEHLDLTGWWFTMTCLVWTGLVWHVDGCMMTKRHLCDWKHNQLH